MTSIRKDTRDPIINSSVCVGLAYDDGVILAADNQSFFGNTNKFETQRVFKVNKKTLVGMNGDHADFHEVFKSIEQKQLEEESQMDGSCLSPLALHTWLTRLNYSKRMDLNPYWVEWIVGGIQDGKPFLGYVNKLGTSYQDRAICTSSLGGIPLSLLREYTDNFNAKINEQEARKLVIKTMQVLFARDCFTSSTFYLATVAKDKDATIEGPLKSQLNWEQITGVIGYDE